MLLYESLFLDDLDHMRELYEHYLNAGASVNNWLREGLADARYAGAKCLDGERMVGVFSGRPGVEFTCGHEDIVELIHQRWQGNNLFTADMLVVLPEYRGQGIARELARKLRESLVRNGCEQLIIEEWHRSVEEDIPVSGVLKYLGRHETIGRYKDFYKDLKAYGLTCPECGGSDCRCGADVCVLTIG